MVSVWSDPRLAEVLITALHIEADRERLANRAAAQRTHERAAARRHWLASQLIRLGHALERQDSRPE